MAWYKQPEYWIPIAIISGGALGVWGLFEFAAEAREAERSGPCIEQRVGFWTGRTNCWHPEHRIEVAGDEAICRCPEQPQNK
jgi:hypothetical protein